jgi:hypothetical protein
MSRLRSILVAAGYLLLAAPLLAQAPAKQPAPQPAPPDTLALARQYTRWFYQGQMDSLAEHWAPVDPPPVSELHGRLAGLVSRAGEEVEVLEEKFVRRMGRTQYWRTARFSHFPEPLLIRWVIGPQGWLAGMGMGPLSAAPEIDGPGAPAVR